MRSLGLEFPIETSGIGKNPLGHATSLGRIEDAPDLYIVRRLSIFFPQTVELAVAGTAFATLIGVPTGTVSALRKDRLPDHATRIFALIGYSIPFFWLALLLQMLAISLLPGWEITGGYSPSSISPSTEPWAFVNLGGTYQLFSQPIHFLVLDAALHGSWAVFMDV